MPLVVFGTLVLASYFFFLMVVEPGLRVKLLTPGSPPALRWSRLGSIVATTFANVIRLAIWLVLAAFALVALFVGINFFNSLPDAWRSSPSEMSPADSAVFYASALGIAESLRKLCLILALSTATVFAFVLGLQFWSAATGTTPSAQDVGASISGVQALRDQIVDAQWTLAIALLALLSAGYVYLTFRSRRTLVQSLLDKERNEQFNALLEKAKVGELPPLEPTKQMVSTSTLIENVSTRINELEGSTEAASKDEAYQLLALRENLERHYAFLDLDRRVDLNFSADSIQHAAPRSTFGKLATFFISPGMVSSLSRAGRVAFATSSFLLVPVSLAAVGTSPATQQQLTGIIAGLEEIAITFADQRADAAWKAMLSHTQARNNANPEAKEFEQWCGANAALCDEHVMRSLSVAFEIAYVGSISRRAGLSTHGAVSLPETAARHAILAEAGTRPVTGGAAIHDVPTLGSAVSEPDDAARYALRESLASTSPSSDTPTRREFRAFLRREVVDARPQAWHAIKSQFAAHAGEFARLPRLQSVEHQLLLRLMGLGTNLSIDVVADGLPLERLHRGSVDDATFRLAARRYVTAVATGHAPTVAATTIDVPENLAAGFRERQTIALQRVAPDIDGAARRAEAILVERPPTLVRFEEPHVNVAAAHRAAEAYQTAAGVTRPVEALSSYDDYFPAWSDERADRAADGDSRRGPVSRPRPTTVSQPKFQAQAHTSSRSFVRLAGSRRIGGVLIGRDPEAPRMRLDFRDIGWAPAQSGSEDISLRLRRSDGAQFVLPNLDPEIVHLALVYAAEGRPTTVTMTTAAPLRELRIQLHPALVDTALGCRAIEVDRFVDVYSSADPSIKLARELGDIPQVVYAFAWAHRTQALVEKTQLILADDLSGELATYAGKQAAAILDNTQLVARAALGISVMGTHLMDPAVSPLVPKSTYFDPQLVSSIGSCLSKKPTAEEFAGCIRAPDASLDGEAAYRRALTPPASYEVWSGVRERSWKLDDALSFAGAIGVQNGSVVAREPDLEQAPLEFMLQTAFVTPPYFMKNVEQWWEAETPRLDSAHDPAPWQFPSVAGRVNNAVLQAVKKDPVRRDELAKVAAFTRLQRLFRAAIAGDLGDAFPLERLAALTRFTKDKVTVSRTPRWNPRAGHIEFAFLADAATTLRVTASDQESKAIRACFGALGVSPELFIERGEQNQQLQDAVEKLAAYPVADWDRSCIFSSGDLAKASLLSARTRALRHALGVAKDDEMLSRRASGPAAASCAKM